VAGTIIADVIQSDQSYPSSINIASPVIISNTFAFPAGTVSAPAFFPTGDTNTGIFFPAADTIAFAEGGAEAMRIDSSGNVGIGVTSPARNLSISGTTISYLQLTNGTAGTAAADGLEIFCNGLDAGISNRENGFLRFDTNNTERMRITSGGNLLVGTTTNTDNVRYLFSTPSGRAAQIITGSSNEWGLSIDVPNNYSDAAYLSRCSRTSGFTDFNFFVGQSNSVTRVQIRGDGNLLNTNNSYGGISDIKLKENIVDATPKLDDLMRVQVRHYNFIGDEQKQIGVVAQELEQVFPGMVDKFLDRDADGNDLGTTTKSVKYSVFVPMLVKAIQELSAKNDALEARIAALEESQP